MSDNILKINIPALILTIVAMIASIYSVKVQAREVINQQALAEKIEVWRQLPLNDQLSAVNNWFNHHFAARSDRQLWGMEDYWASPAEFMSMGGGDCEDFALAKYHVLRILGVSEEKLRLVYSRLYNPASGIEPHMVLVVINNNDAYALDNVTDVIARLDQRTDLVPKFAFNTRSVWKVEQRNQMRMIGNASGLPLWTAYRARLNRNG